MADLNKKLNNILNKNYLDVHCNTESQSHGGVKIKVFDKNVKRMKNTIEKNLIIKFLFDILGNKNASKRVRMFFYIVERRRNIKLFLM